MQKMYKKVLHLFNFKRNKCTENHWHIIEGKLILDTPTDEQSETAREMVKALEGTIRLKIYEDICDLNLTTDMKQILKVGKGNMGNALLAVQAICADIALGNNK